MKTVNIHEAKTTLSRLVAEAVAGEEVVIARAGKPLVRLVAVSASAGPRTLGRLAGQVIESENCWERDLGTEALFYGGSVEPVPVRRVAEPGTGGAPGGAS
jgi:prevent-host-death family protein